MRGVIVTILLLMAVSILGAALATAQEEQPAQASVEDESKVVESAEKAARVFIIIVHNTVDWGLEFSIKRRVEEARESMAGRDEPAVIIFDVDTFGGHLDSAFAISDFVFGIRDMKTVAYVSEKAISAGAMFTVACQEIVMREGTTLGDCEPIAVGGPSGVMELGEKFHSPIRAKFRAYAERNGYPLALSEAMVTKDIEVYKLSMADGTQRYATEDDLKSMSDLDTSDIKSKQILIAKGKLLTMTAQEAKRFEFAREVVRDRSEVVSMYAEENAEQTVLDTTWSEELVRFLNNPAVTSFLMLLGLVGVYFAFKVPGMGLPEGIALLCFATVFLSKYLVGLTTWADIALFVVGLLLIAVEILLIPGFGVAGIVGIVCVLAGMIFSLQRFTIPTMPHQYEVFGWNLVTVLGTLIGSIVVFAIIAHYMPSTPYLRRVVLTTTQETASGQFTVAEASRQQLLGAEGVTITKLRPAGRAEFDEEIVDVVAEGEYLEQGEKIKVTNIRGNRVVVRKA